MKLLLFLDDDPTFNLHEQFQALSKTDKILREYDCKLINDENEAYDYLTNNAPEIIFLDLMWRGAPYYGVNNIFPNLQKLVPNIPVIIMTESDKHIEDPEYIADIKGKGMATYFSKKDARVYEKWKKLTKDWLKIGQHSFMNSVNHHWTSGDKQRAMLLAVSNRRSYDKLLKAQLRQLYNYFVQYITGFSLDQNLVPFAMIAESISVLLPLLQKNNIHISFDENLCFANSIFHSGDLQKAADHLENLWRKNKRNATIPHKLLTIYELEDKQAELQKLKLVLAVNEINLGNFPKAESYAADVISKDRYNYDAHLLKLKAAFKKGAMGEEFMTTLLIFSERTPTERQAFFLQFIADIKITISAILQQISHMARDARIDARDMILEYCLLCDKWDWGHSVMADSKKQKDMPRDIVLLFKLVRGFLSIRSMTQAKTAISLAIAANPQESHRLLLDLCMEEYNNHPDNIIPLLSCAKYDTVSDRTLLFQYAELCLLSGLMDAELQIYNHIEAILDDYESQSEFYDKLIARFREDFHRKKEYVKKLIDTHLVNNNLLKAMFAEKTFLTEYPTEAPLIEQWQKTDTSSEQQSDSNRLVDLKTILETVFNDIEFNGKSIKILSTNIQDSQLFKLIKTIDGKLPPTPGANVQIFEELKKENVWEYRFSQKGRVYVQFRKDAKPLIYNIDYSHKHKG